MDELSFLQKKGIVFIFEDKERAQVLVEKLENKLREYDLLKHFDVRLKAYKYGSIESLGIIEANPVFLIVQASMWGNTNAGFEILEYWHPLLSPESPFYSIVYGFPITKAMKERSLELHQKDSFHLGTCRDDPTTEELLITKIVGALLQIDDFLVFHHLESEKSRTARDFIAEKIGEERMLELLEKKRLAAKRGASKTKSISSNQLEALEDIAMHLQKRLSGQPMDEEGVSSGETTSPESSEKKPLPDKEKISPKAKGVPGAIAKTKKKEKEKEKKAPQAKVDDKAADYGIYYLVSYILFAIIVYFVVISAQKTWGKSNVPVKQKREVTLGKPIVIEGNIQFVDGGAPIPLSTDKFYFPNLRVVFSFPDIKYQCEARGNGIGFSRDGNFQFTLYLPEIHANANPKEVIVKCYRDGYVTVETQPISLSGDPLTAYVPNIVMKKRQN